MIWSLLFGAVKFLAGPLFNFLNARVSADEQIHIVDTQSLVAISAAGLGAASKADEIMGQVRMKEGNWGPTVIFMAAVLTPLVWHEWQVVLDSSRWVPAMAWPPVAEHIIGSWKVAALPGVWEVTEQAIFTSLFIGASAAVGAVAAIQAWGRHVRT